MCRSTVPGGYPACDNDHGEPSSYDGPSLIEQYDAARARRILPWILKQASNADEMTAFCVTSLSLLHTELWQRVNDPAKLAEMLAERGRQLGFGAYYGRLVSPERYPMLVFTHGELEVHIRIAADRSEFGAYSFVRTYLMPSTRALLAAWLALPDGDRVGAENALRSVT